MRDDDLDVGGQPRADGPSENASAIFSDAMADAMDGVLRSWFARASGGVSGLALATAGFDWAAHLAVSPGRRARIAADAWRNTAEAGFAFWTQAFAGAAEGNGAPAAAAERVLSALAEAHDAHAQWMDRAIASVPGVSTANVHKVQFAARQAWEAVHPYNFALTNPKALRVTIEEGGANFMRGSARLLEDVLSATGAAQPREVDEPRVGESLAVTPGRVVYRNHLIELIQYEPTTATVRKEPILIVPAWIMKYYILDLSPQKSLVKYLVDQGYTVFIMSWRNPDEGDRDLSFDDYRTQGVLAALDAASAIAPGVRFHGVGYCLGGTLLAVAAAGLAQADDDRFASLTLLAAQTDFRDSGELSLFIDESQLTLLDSAMDASGYLDAKKMSGAFTMLRSRELFWKHVQRAYFLGEDTERIDLMAWNADATRMPHKMHSEYLRKFYMQNDFVQGRLQVDGRPVAISDIRAPMFVLATSKDHVAPWRSVFKIHLFADAEVTFALTNGGHNAGVVSPPDHPRRHHQIRTKADCEHYIDPDAWLALAEAREGSWWPSWLDWLNAQSRSGAEPRTPKRADAPGNVLPARARLPAAPGSYVHQKV